MKCRIDACSAGRAIIGISEPIDKNPEVTVVGVESILKAGAVCGLRKVQDASHDSSSDNLAPFSERHSFPGD
jgi:hypothetical protein